MIHFKKECYKVVVDNDFNASRVLAYFTNYSDAEKAGKGKSSWGSDGRVSAELISITVFENYEEYENAGVEAIKATALAKLTTEEKKILGLI